VDTQQLLEQIHRLRQRTTATPDIVGVHAEVAEFLRLCAGPKSEFLSNVKSFDPRNRAYDYVAETLRAVLNAYLAFVQAGLHQAISPERRAKLDVVSDFLGQAQALLDSRDIHPVAPTVIIGAALEEFLRNWIEAEELNIENQKPGIDAYAKALRENDLITKQDYKDITSWAGLRNHAAHGEWAEVSEKARVSLMLEGVNLFMRKYGA
jgi:hypothetical protein